MRSSIGRRRFVQTVGGGVAVGLAGCSDSTGGDDAPDGNGEETTPTDTPEDTDQGGSDEPSTGNVIYAFAPDRISIIEPEAGSPVTPTAMDSRTSSGR